MVKIKNCRFFSLDLEFLDDDNHNVYRYQIVLRHAFVKSCSNIQHDFFFVLFTVLEYRVIKRSI